MTPLAQAQTITAAPVSPASIPVDHPGALLLLALAIAACVPWMLRKGLLSPHRVRAVGAGLAAAFLCATSFTYMEYSKIVLTDTCLAFMVMLSLSLFWNACSFCSMKRVP